MMTNIQKNPRKSKGNDFLQPIIPLQQLPKDKDCKPKYLTVSLNIGIAGQKATKKDVYIFDGGSPEEWIEFLMALEEIFLQNALAAPEDRATYYRNFMKGDNLITFNSVLEEDRGENEGAVAGVVLPLTLKIVSCFFM